MHNCSRPVTIAVLTTSVAVTAMRALPPASANISTRPATPASVTLRSPDGKIGVTVETGSALTYTVAVDDRTVIRPSAIALRFRGAPPLGPGLCTVHAERRSIGSRWENRWGKRRWVTNHANELRLQLREPPPGARRMALLLRAYNDGIALRCEIPRQAGLERFVLEEEATQFRFAGDPTVWAADYGGYASAQESEFRRHAMQQMSMAAPYGVPLVVHTTAGPYVAVTEADLQDWGGMYLSRGLPSGEKRVFASGVMRGGEPARTLRVPLDRQRLLRLVIGDGGDDFTYDHADWADARLIAIDGSSVPLSSLRPIMVVQGFGTLTSDRSVEGHPLSIGGVGYAHGLGAHSKGEIVYALDGRYRWLEARVGIDDEVGRRGTATFELYVAPTAAAAETTLVTRLAPRHDGNGLVRGSTPHRTPWRVLMVGRRPGDLVESDLILNLSEPCALRDTAWIKPGKCAWDHWWSADVRMDTQTEKAYIAFAAEMGFPYQLMDWQWYGPFNTPTADITNVNPNLDLPAVLRFAAEKGVRLFAWLHSADVDRKLREGALDDIFERYRSWGLAGIKIDFMDRDDQEMVNWYHTIIRKAADHRLMVDFHGAYKPTGTHRTYPNQITREGVMGEEYAKFSNRLTPEHDCTLPFTRMLAGPMDYTPGGFLNRTRAQWQQTVPTQVMGTRAHELAKFVVFESPLTVVCDAPEHYCGQPGLDFLRAVPTVWDETRVLDGAIGERIAVARRSGTRWFVGGMVAGPGRAIVLPLDFLGTGRYTARIYADAADADRDAEKLAYREQNVNRTGRLSIRVAADGGFAIELLPHSSRGGGTWRR